MLPLTKKQELPEIKKRIRALLPNILDSESRSDSVIINNTHSIHFTIRNKDYILTGTIAKRV